MIIVMHEGEILFRGAYHYRKIPVAVMATLLVLVCVPLFFWFAWALVAQGFTQQKLLIALFPMSILGLLGWVGCLLGFYYLSFKNLELIVSNEGVSYGGKFTPWDQVACLLPQNYKGQYQLLLHRRSRAPMALDRRLITDHGLTEDECRHLMHQLQVKVASAHPHLAFE